MIKTQSLTKIYSTHEIRTTALNRIDVEVGAGEFLAIMGPSGCGKSTFLNVLGMLDTPTSGDYFFKGENVASYNESKLSEIRKYNVGFIFQSFNLIDGLSVFNNIELALLYQDMSSKERKARVDQVMQKVGIGHRAGHMPNQLSGGQQQRVAIARAVVGQKSIILADEPTGNLDSKHGNEVMEMLQSLNQDGTTIIMVTHSSTDAGFAQRTINLMDGALVAECAVTDA